MVRCYSFLNAAAVCFRFELRNLQAQHQVLLHVLWFVLLHSGNKPYQLITNYSKVNKAVLHIIFPA